MPWLRTGDDAATHPIVTRVVSLVRRSNITVDEADVAVNEVFGFVTRLAVDAAGHTTDYVIEEGTALTFGGNRTERLLELAIDAGYLKRRRRGKFTTYVLVDDPEFLHMRTRAEIEHERQRKSDNANPALTVPVRLRDGDECRYCGVIVNWRARKGGRAGTYDHRTYPATVDTFVIACNACNAGRRDDPNADTRYPLRPAPTQPIYGPETGDFLANAGHRVTVTEDLRPGHQPGHAPRDPAPSGTTPPPPTRHAPVTRTTPRDPAPSGTTPHPARPAHTGHGSADPAGRLPSGSGFPGSGRDGSGGATAGDPAGTRASPARRRKRSPRSRTPNRPGAD